MQCSRRHAGLKVAPRFSAASSCLKRSLLHLTTVGFTKLGDVTRRSAKSLIGMLGPKGNPQARNLFEIVACLQRAEGVRFEVRAARAASSSRNRASSHTR